MAKNNVHSLSKREFRLYNSCSNTKFLKFISPRHCSAGIKLLAASNNECCDFSKRVPIIFRTYDITNQNFMLMEELSLSLPGF